jgi:hypothetical protein
MKVCVQVFFNAMNRVYETTDPPRICLCSSASGGLVISRFQGQLDDENAEMMERKNLKILYLVYL